MFWHHKFVVWTHKYVFWGNIRSYYLNIDGLPLWKYKIFFGSIIYYPVGLRPDRRACGFRAGAREILREIPRTRLRSCPLKGATIANFSMRAGAGFASIFHRFCHILQAGGGFCRFWGRPGPTMSVFDGFWMHFCMIFDTFLASYRDWRNLGFWRPLLCFGMFLLLRKWRFFCIFLSFSGVEIYMDFW